MREVWLICSRCTYAWSTLVADEHARYDVDGTWRCDGCGVYAATVLEVRRLVDDESAWELEGLPAREPYMLESVEVAPRFLGREYELAELESALSEPGVRGVIIFGKSGVGKSELARQFVSQWGETFDGAFVVEGRPRGVAESLQGLLKTHGRRDALLVVEPSSPRGSWIDELERLADNGWRYIYTGVRDPMLLPPVKRLTLEPLNARQVATIVTGDTADDRSLAIAQRVIERLSDSPLLLNLAMEAALARRLALGQVLRYLEPATVDGVVDTTGEALSTGSPEFERIELAVRTSADELIALLARNPELMYQLEPRRFEEMVAEVLARMGFAVTLTQASRDGGVDVYAAKSDGVGSFLYLVDCKRYAPERHGGGRLVREL